MYNMIQLTMTSLGLVQGYLALKNLRINWLIHIICNVLVILWSYHFKLYAETGYNVVMIILAVFGWINWADKNVKKELKVSRNTLKEWSITLVFLLVLYIALIFILKSLNGTNYYLDALAAALGIAGTILMTRRKIDCWYIWTMYNVTKIVLYSSLGTFTLYLLLSNIFWLGMNVLSYKNWENISNKVLKIV